MRLISFAFLAAVGAILFISTVENAPIKAARSTSLSRPQTHVQSKPRQPAKPKTQAQPHKPKQPTKPKTVKPKTPVQAHKPKQPTKAKQPTKPKQKTPIKPKQPIKAKTPKPKNPVKPPKTKQPTKPKQPIKPKSPVQPTKPKTPVIPKFHVDHKKVLSQALSKVKSNEILDRLKKEINPQKVVKDVIQRLDPRNVLQNIKTNFNPQKVVTDILNGVSPKSIFSDFKKTLMDPVNLLKDIVGIAKNPTELINIFKENLEQRLKDYVMQKVQEQLEKHLHLERIVKYTDDGLVEEEEYVLFYDGPLESFAKNVNVEFAKKQTFDELTIDEMSLINIF